MNINDRIGRNIRFMRTLRGFTLAHVADRLVDNGWNVVSATTVGRWERGDTPIPADVLLPLSEVFGCTVYSFYFIDKGETNLDARLMDELNSLPKHERDILLWLNTEWNGDSHVLIEFCALYASLPPVGREYIARIGIEEYVYGQSMGEVSSAIDIDLQKITAGWHRLEKERDE